MIIFKTTFHLDEKIHDEALAYIKNVYIPEAMKGGILYMPQLSLQLVEYEEAGGSYTLQFRVRDRAALNKWLEEEGGSLKADMDKTFGEGLCCFVTLQKRIDI